MSMKKLLIAAVIFSVIGVAQGYAQEMAQDEPQGEATTENVAQQAEAAKPADPFAGMIIAKSEIKSVTVYKDRAKITRVAEVDVPAGAKTVAFKDLPAALMADSLRAEGSAPAAVTLGAIVSKQVMTARLSSAKEQDLHDRIQALNDQKAPIESEKAALAAQEKFLKNIGEQAALRNNENLAQIDLKPEQWTAAAQAIHNGLAEVYKSREQQDIRLRDINLEISRLQRELSQISTGQRSIFTVLVPVESEKPAKLTLEISYQMPNASWHPIYDARAMTDGKGSLKLVQYGAVSQRTGEDWKGVALTLSTAQPQRGAGLPDLTPMWVDVYERGRYAPQQLQIDSVDSFEGGGPAGAGGATMFKSMSSNIIPSTGAFEAKREAAAPPPQAATMVAADASTRGFVAEYKIPGPADVPSDGTESKLLVGNFDVESKLQVHIKPQMSAEAYLVVRSKLKGDAPILPGQVNLFRDEAYVGQSMLPMLRPDEEHDLYFGVDDQVAVKRKVVKDERKEAGVIAKDAILERSYVTELQNLHTAPIDIVVKETIPAPRNEKIRVEIGKETTTPGYEVDAGNIKGLVDWQFKMEPKEKKDLKLSWTVSWPSDMTMSGL
jgi:uncharacterized protein (TIGR02231 family)